MKKILVVTILVLIAVLAGWLTFARSPGKAIFTIETQKISDDAKEAIDKGKDLSKELFEKKHESKPTTSEKELEPKT